MTQIFNVNIDGKIYDAHISGSGHRAHFYVSTTPEGVVIDNSGECNPLEALWGTYEYQSADDAKKLELESKEVEQAIRFELSCQNDGLLDD